MDKQEQAQRFAEIMLKHGYESDLCFDENLYQMVAKDAWILTDAMQKEANSRINKDRPTVLQDEFQATGYETPTDEWQPDWSQAPDDVVGWIMNERGKAKWITVINEVNWYQSAPSFGYQGSWQDSLRKRP